jgi:bisphosphoglycerate-dependent phosphoglycerate mutase
MATSRARDALKQREVVIAAHDACIRELLQEVNVRESGQAHETPHD